MGLNEYLNFVKVYHLICSIGLLIHVTIMTVQYLQYETTTSLYLELPTTIESQAVSLCFPYNELLDGDWIELKYGNHTRIINSLDMEDLVVQQALRNITMADVFENTPPVDDMYGVAYVRS